METIGTIERVDIVACERFGMNMASHCVIRTLDRPLSLKMCAKPYNN